ncbi:MAG: ribonuclease PH [bacterium]
MNLIAREDGRAVDQLRPVLIQYDVLGYANASVLFSIGNTKVLTSVSLQVGLPPFLRGQQTGWLTAEYAMLPCSSQQRINRESTQGQRNSRSVEISRLIGRCLCSVVNLDLLPDKTIIVDCDVLQADGGTRVACLTAASLALNVAAQRWVDAGLLEHNVVKDSVAAISAGIIQDSAYLDLSYQEDSRVDADFNFVMTKSGALIEIQGTAEKNPIVWAQFDFLKTLASKGISELFSYCAGFVPPDQYNPVILSYKNKPEITFHTQKSPSSGQEGHIQKKKVSFNLGKRVGKF